METKEFDLKYRPIQLSDVVGQEKTIAILNKQAETNQFDNVYLFVGQFGSGKTSVGRIMASLLTCPNKNGSKVCGTCNVCKAIHGGHCVDIFEIDGASNRGIDDARNIRETSNYAPQELSKKIYLIDEAHKLTSDAWNALLKILEEPPSYVVFIFCTTDYRSIPPAVLSRCQKLMFTQINSDDIGNHLKKISDKENIKIDDGSIKIISRVSKGSMRNALSYLQEISVFKNNNVTEKDTLEYLGLPEESIIYEMVGCMIDQNAPLLMEKIDLLLKLGIDTKTIIYEVSSVLRNIFICKTCGKDSKLLDITKPEIKIISDFSEKAGKNGLIKIAGSLSRVEKEINLNINERWILEAALTNCLLLIKE